MAETGEIVVGVSVVGAFLGAVGAAFKIGGKSPGSNQEDGDVMQRISTLEKHVNTLQEQQRQHELDRVEANLQRTEIFRELRRVGNGVMEIKGALGLSGGLGD